MTEWIFGYINRDHLADIGFHARPEYAAQMQKHIFIEFEYESGSIAPASASAGTGFIIHNCNVKVLITVCFLPESRPPRRAAGREGGSGRPGRAGGQTILSDLHSGQIVSSTYRTSIFIPFLSPPLFNRKLATPIFYHNFFVI